MGECLVEARGLKKYFGSSRGILGGAGRSVKAVDDISFSISSGETLGLVGESGCGKSTLIRSILRLTEPTSGQVLYRGEDILGYSKEQMRQMRRKMQIIFQDPYASLNPRMTVTDLVQAPLDVFSVGSAEEREQKVIDILQTVGLGEQFLNRYPHEFSGGQRQRIGIARALILEPEFVVCDEPVSALDVSVRAQVLNLLQDLKKQMGLTLLFISHDLSVVKHISDRIGVMYLGKLMELTSKEELYDNPLHPYTSALLSAIPIPDVHIQRNRQILQGDIPSPYNPPSGCRFHTRCPRACPQCREREPVMTEVSPGHSVACHLYSKSN